MTGAGSRMAGEIGNGRAAAILLARQGARVALVDRDGGWARDTKRVIDAEGGVAEVVVADVTDERSCREAVARTVALFGGLHVLVNIGEFVWANGDGDEGRGRVGFDVSRADLGFVKSRRRRRYGRCH